MDSRRKELQRLLKTINQKSLEHLCKVAGLNEEETILLVMAISREASEYAIARRINCCPSSIQKRKKKALEKLVGFIDCCANEPQD